MRLIALILLCLTGCASVSDRQARISQVEENIKGYERELTNLNQISMTNQNEWAKSASVNEQWNDEDLFDTLKGIKSRAAAQDEIITNMTRDRFELANIRTEMSLW